MMSVNTIFPTN